MFSEYNSIENVSSKTIEAVKELCGDDIVSMEWIATEKIHGANFSAITDGNTVSWARRSGIIEKTEKFYNYQKITKQFEDDIKDLFNNIKFANIKKKKEIEFIQIYGELFGGAYPHNDVPKVQGACKVQDGVYYHPDNQFMIFDGRYMLKNNKTTFYFDYDDLLKYIPKFSKLQTCQILKRGTLDELKNLDPYFQTTIPNLYGLPPIENNYAEGYVLKPVKTVYNNDGERVALKLKRSNLSEKITDLNVAKNSSKKSDTKILVFSYLNENRLASVKSKLTDDEREDNDLMITKLVEDAWKDIGKEHDITQFDITSLTKVMKSYSQKFVK
jgi:Rnl2 family RNA ligase